MKNLKKLLAITLVAALTLGGAVTTAFADTTTYVSGFKSDNSGEVENTTGAEMKIAALVAIPPIKVKIGKMTNMILNPYKLSYATVDSLVNTTTTGGSPDNKSVISTDVLIESQSKVGLKIEAQPSVTKYPDGLSNLFVTSETEKTAAGDNAWILLWLEMKEGTAKSGKTTSASSVSDDLETITWSTSAPSVETTPADGLAVVKQNVTDTNKADTAILSLAAASDSAYQYGAFRLTGDCGGSTWDSSKFTSGNGIEISIVFNITPVAVTTGS